MKRTAIFRAGSGILAVLFLMFAFQTNAAALEREGSARVEKELSVLVDGKEVVFTDACPENRENRNFLPFRAIFDALGAEVSYEDYTNTAVAVREDIRVEVPIGTNRVIVTRNGVREVVEMDVCSYIKDGRTYVPVRFMAQVLGYRVEWDQANVAITLIDVEKLVDQVMAGRTYTILEESRVLMDRYSGEACCVEGGMEYVLEQEGRVMASALAEYRGLTAPDGGMQLCLSVNADYSAWYQDQAQKLGVTAADLGLDEQNLYPGIEWEMRRDVATERCYFYVTSAEGLGDTIPQKVWFSQSVGTEINGLDLVRLNEMGNALDAAVLIRAALSELDLTDSTTAMERARARASEVAWRLSDAMASGTQETKYLAWTVGGVTHALTAGYDESGVLSEILWEQGEKKDGVEHVNRLWMDVRGKVTLTTAVQGDGQSVFLRQSGTCTPTEELPQTTPPEGASVMPYGAE